MIGALKAFNRGNGPSAGSRRTRDAGGLNHGRLGSLSQMRKVARKQYDRSGMFIR